MRSSPEAGQGGSAEPRGRQPRSLEASNPQTAETQTQNALDKRDKPETKRSQVGCQNKEAQGRRQQFDGQVNVAALPRNLQGWLPRVRAKLTWRRLEIVDGLICPQDSIVES